MKKLIMILTGIMLLTSLTYSQTFKKLHDFNPIHANGGNPRGGVIMDGSFLYGTATTGGKYNFGVVYRTNTDGSGYTILHSFNASDGSNPFGSLTLKGNVLYGITYDGGDNVCGTIYSVNTDGTAFKTMHSFNSPEGAYPYASLTESNGALYGTTYAGGTYGNGIIFKINDDGSGFSVLHSLNNRTDGSNSSASVIVEGENIYGIAMWGGPNYCGTLFSMKTDGTGFTLLRSFEYYEGHNPTSLTMENDVLYGTTVQGGDYWSGTIYSINTDGTGYKDIYSFDNSDYSPQYQSLIVSGGTLYGTTCQGGNNYYGSIYRLNTDGTGFAVLRNFNYATDGGSLYPCIFMSGNVLYGTSYSGAYGFGTIYKIGSDGTGFTVLYKFGSSDSYRPDAGLIESGDYLYGTTFSGGEFAQGTAYRIKKDGTEMSILHSFNGNDGANLCSSLILSDGVLYGTASTGGEHGNGTIFRLNPDGTGFAVLHSLNSFTDGGIPYSGLTEYNGLLYGTTSSGGPGTNSIGTIYKINKDGSGFTVLHSMSYYSDGGCSYSSLLQIDGVLYGTAYYGGPSYYGTIFRINSDGTGFAVLRALNYYSDGGYPQSSLIQSNGILYGTAFYGGSNYAGTIFSLKTDGTGFTVLRNFNYSNDASYPNGSLILSGSELYGTTNNGGTNYAGTIFRIKTDGTGFTILRSLNSNQDGAYPHAGLIKSGSILYGTNAGGGIYGGGTVFSLELTAGLPNLYTYISSVSENAINCGGNITDNGGEAVTARGVCWNTSASPDITGSHTIDGSGSGYYSSQITGLLPQTNYYIRAYATNPNGTGYGKVLNIWTLSKEPESQTNTFTSNYDCQGGALLSFQAASEINNASGYIILRRQGATAPTAAGVIDGLPPDSLYFPAGTTLAANIDNSSSKTFTDIQSEGSQYSYSIIAYNRDGVNYQTYNYLTIGTIPTTTVTFGDFTPPVVKTKDITVNLNSSGYAGISASDIDNGSTDNCGIASMTVTPSSFDCPDKGINVVTLEVTDLHGNVSTGYANVTVKDITSPALTVSVSPTSLWPPDHKLQTITASVSASDNCSDGLNYVLESITSNEPDNGLGDGDTENDIQNADYNTSDLSFRLRAERSGTGSGRTYTITYKAIDESGNVTRVSATVRVPHSKERTIQADGAEQNQAQSSGLIANIYPNPAGNSVNISYIMPERGQVRIEIRDILGNVVADLFNGELAQGEHSLNWDGSDLHGSRVTDGVYYVRITTGLLSESCQIRIIK